jgi:hypothetical protein
MHTKAKIELNGDRAVLTQGGEKLVARILAPSAPAKIVFAAASAKPPEPENQNAGVSKLVVKLTASDKPMRLAILLTPGSSPAAQPPAITPLAEWKSKPL